MGLAETIPPQSVEDYFAIEESSPEKYEYVDGFIRAMSGGTRMHSKIRVNLIAELSQRLRGQPYEPYESSYRISIPGGHSYFYPDASVICGPVEVDKKNEDAATNPTAIFEVLSPSTEGFDRKKKLIVYRQCPSLRDYVLINHDMPLVEVYHRDETGQWLRIVYTDLATTAHVASIDLDLPLSSLYEDVEFPPEQKPNIVVRKGGSEYVIH